MEGSHGGGRDKGVGVGRLFPCMVQVSGPPGTLQGLPVLPAFQQAGAFGEAAYKSPITRKSIICHSAQFFVYIYVSPT